MNGFAFCETDSKRQVRQHRYRLHELTKLTVVPLKCETNLGEECCKNMANGHVLSQKNYNTLVKYFQQNFGAKQVDMKQTLVIVLLCCVYYNALYCDFTFDDKSAIIENKDLLPETPLRQLLWNDFWGQPMTKVSCLSHAC